MLWRKLHFELIARAVAKHRPAWTIVQCAAVDVVIDALADALAPTNPKFDRQRFINAATGREETTK